MSVINMARKGNESDPRTSVKSVTSTSADILTKCKSELDLVKNKSNLYLIKSYSFIDKTTKRNSFKKIHSGKHSEVTDFDEICQLWMNDKKKSLKVKSKSGTESDCDDSLLRKKSDREGGGRFQRPRSLPASGNVKRESFLRQSFQSIRRSFAKKSSHSNGHIVMSSSSSGGSEKMHLESDFEGEDVVNGGGVRTCSNLDDLKEEDESRISKSTSVRTVAVLDRSTSSVSTLAHSAPGSPMAPLQGHSETQSVNCLNTIGKNSSPFITQPIASSTVSTTIGSKGDNKSLRQSSSAPLSSVPPTANLRSISPNSKGTIVAKNEIPEKEKKRKEISSSRVKKFHRHFQQVSKDERVINYFSCALVSDILLQGHLYITDNHFAFYSNVFGYVTKVVIPTSSVTKISKEKTAKIIPNAVGVATADERHVFSSFISRESAFRLMCSVCSPLAPIQLIPKAVPDVEISEECSIEDDSSCSISGNESPPQPIDMGATTTTAMATSDAGQTLLRRSNKSGDSDVGKGDLISRRHSEHPNAKNMLNSTGGIRASAPPASLNTTNSASPTSSKHQPHSSSTTTSASIPEVAIIVGNLAIGQSSSFTSTSSTSSASSVVTGQASSSLSSSPNTVVSSSSTAFKAFSQSAIVRLKFPTEFHIVYLGVVLSIVLAIFSGFLLYRILDIEAKTSLYQSPVDFNWGSGNNADIFAEALRWQKELQTKSTEEAQSILHTNLQQIAKVRRSLETLSMLIHDRSSSSSPAYEAEGGMDQDDTD